MSVKLEIEIVGRQTKTSYSVDHATGYETETAIRLIDAIKQEQFKMDRENMILTDLNKAQKGKDNGR